MTHGHHMDNYNTQIALHSQIKMLNRCAASTYTENLAFLHGLEVGNSSHFEVAGFLIDPKV